MTVQDTSATIGASDSEIFRNMGDISIVSYGLIINSIFENHGNLTVIAGFLRVRSPVGSISSHYGNFDHNSGATIEFQTGTHYFQMPGIFQEFSLLIKGQFGPGQGIIFSTNIQIFNNFLPSVFQANNGSIYVWTPYNTPDTITVNTGAELRFKSNVTMGTLINHGNFFVERIWIIGNITNYGSVTLNTTTTVVMTGIFK